MYCIGYALYVFTEKKVMNVENTTQPSPKVNLLFESNFLEFNAYSAICLGSFNTSFNFLILYVIS